MRKRFLLFIILFILGLPIMLFGMLISLIKINYSMGFEFIEDKYDTNSNFAKKLNEDILKLKEKNKK